MTPRAPVGAKNKMSDNSFVSFVFVLTSGISSSTCFLTFVHVLGVVEGEGDGEAAEEEDGGRDAPHHHALPGVAPALRVRADETDGIVIVALIGIMNELNYRSVLMGIILIIRIHLTALHKIAIKATQP